MRILTVAAVIATAIAMSACGSGPKLTICVLNGDPKNPELSCHNSETGDDFRQPYNEKVKNWLAMSPEDARTQYEYYKLRCVPSKKPNP